MEALTDGVCASTTHRVLSPRKGEGARYSVPFFQGVSYDAKFEAMDVPESVLKLRDEARKARVVPTAVGANSLPTGNNAHVGAIADGVQNLPCLVCAQIFQ
jgi:isopenicillin N synthase-like dioxygenase